VTAFVHTVWMDKERMTDASPYERECHLP
jgi:hypothetical protein